MGGYLGVHRIGLDHSMHCVFYCVCFDCICVIVCYKLHKLYSGMMYIENSNTRVEKHNIRSSGNKRMDRDIRSIIGWRQRNKEH